MKRPYNKCTVARGLVRVSDIESVRNLSYLSNTALSSDILYASRLQTVRERGMPSAQVRYAQELDVLCDL